MEMKRLLHQQTGMLEFFYPVIFMVIQYLLPIVCNQFFIWQKVPHTQAEVFTRVPPLLCEKKGVKPFQFLLAGKRGHECNF